MKDTASKLSAMYELSQYIHAPRELIFEIISDVSGWPRWQPSIKLHSTPKPIEGVTFRWTDDHLLIQSRFNVLEPNEISWRNRFLWYSSEVRWILESDEAGTHVSYEQVLYGFGAAMIRPMLKKSMALTLAQLAKEAEHAPVLSYS